MKSGLTIKNARGTIVAGRIAQRAALLALLLSLMSVSLTAAPDSAPARRAEKIYQEAKQAHAAKPEDVTLAWQFTRAVFDWAEFSQNDEQREKLALEGIAVSESWREKKPKEVGVLYYLAMNKGQLARTRLWTALGLVTEMEQLFQTTRDLDEKFDYAGPDRNLGLLYLDAPGWPASIGNKTKARTHLARALKLVPSYPENHLCFMEALLRWKDKDALAKQMKAYEQMLPAAKKEFTGEAAEQSWIDWERRWKEVREKSGLKVSAE